MFRTPSHNINCIVAVGEGFADARCDISARDWEPPPRPADCELDWGTGLFVGTAEAGVVCAGDTAANNETVPYGTVIALGPFRCEVRETGVTCMNTTTRHGFVISRRSYRLF